MQTGAAHESELRSTGEEGGVDLFSNVKEEVINEWEKFSRKIGRESKGKLPSPRAAFGGSSQLNFRRTASDPLSKDNNEKKNS